jgi:hypothetical protein
MAHPKQVVGGASFRWIVGRGMSEQPEGPELLLERPPAIFDPVRDRRRRRKPMQAFPSPRERTRSRNRDRYTRSPTRDFELEFRCECARTDCDVRLPLGVERHRRWTDRFIVGPAHVDGDTVVGVADRFLVVEANGLTPSLYPLPAPPAERRARTTAA